MVRRTCLLAILITLLAGAGACADPVGDRILRVRATGTLVGLVFLDRNGNLTLDPTDAPVPGVAVQVVPAGTRAPAARVVSGVTGGFIASDLPVGDYDLIVEPATVPDSVRLVLVLTTPTPPDPTKVRVTVGDTAAAMVVLGYPTVTVAEARALPAGQRVFVEGVTLNAWTTYGDSTLHVADSTGVIRGTRVAPVAVSSGQRVRLLGTTDARDGQGTLTDAVAFPLGSGQLPAPVVVSSAVAAGADNGRLDAALVRVSGATILGGQASAFGDFILTVTDGSGLLEVMLDASAGISPSPYVPGGILTATGLLVPNPARPGEWQLKPRSASDLSVSFTSATIADARQLEVGRIVMIEGVALNSWAAFGDSTVHVADATGSIRAVRVQPANLFAGDRVRMLGTITFRDGQPVLSNVTPTVLGQGVLPLPERVSTEEAAHAVDGRLDAALVRVTGVIVGDTTTVTPDFRLRVEDGSGLLEILLDRDAGFQLGPLVPGRVLDVTGLLVPAAGGRDWMLKPRQQADVAAVGFANHTVAQARGLPAGTLVSVEAVALNAWPAFADSTVHIADSTGAVRSVRVRPAGIVAGSRVRLLGTVASVAGQPTITNVIAAVLSAGPPPIPETVNAATARGADSGRLDAALVGVTQVTIADTATVSGGDFRVRVTDSSGELEVLLDRDAGFQAGVQLGVFAPGNVLNVTGLLVALPGEGSVWRLKPRAPADIVVLP